MPRKSFPLAIAAAVVAGTLATTCAPPPPVPAQVPLRAAGEREELPTWTPIANASPTASESDRSFEEARAAFLSGDASAREMLRRHLDAFPLAARRSAVEAMLSSLDRAVATPTGPLALGAALPLSGKYAKYGQAAKRAVELAIENVTRRPGAPAITLSCEDTASDPARAGAAAETLVSAGVLGMVGPLTGAELAACVTPAGRAGVPIVAPAAGGRAAKAWPGVFTLGISPDMQGDEIRRFASWRRYRRLALLHPKTPYGAALATALSRTEDASGVTVVDAVPYLPGQADFSSEIVRLGGVDAGLVRQEEEREKAFIQDKTETELASLLSFLAPGAVPATPSATPRSKKKKKPTEPPTAIPTPSITPEATPRVLVFDFVPEDPDSAAAMIDRKFGARLALLLRQQTAFEVIGGTEFLRLAAGAGSPVDLSGAFASTALARAATEQRLDFVVSGSVRSAPGAFYLHTRLYDVVRTRLVLDSVCVYERAFPPAPNPKGLDAVVVAGKGHDVPQLVSQLVFYDLRVPVIGTADWDPDEVSRSGEKSLVGAVFPSPFTSRSARKEAREFVRAYSDAAAAPPDLWAALAFDAANTLLAPVVAGVRDRAVLAEEVAAGGPSPAATGLLSFRGAGEALRRFEFFEVASGGGLEALPP